MERKNTTFVESDDDTDRQEDTREQTKIDYANIHLDEVFVTTFKKHCMNDVTAWRNKWDIQDNNIIFCKDCSRESIWRNAFHDNYKGTRVVASSFNGLIFPIFYELLTTLPNTSIVCNPCLEADDVAFLSTKRITASDSGFTKKVIIITNDNDYLQMRKENVNLFNLIGKGTNLETRSKGAPEIDLLIKILMGDSSDNIQAVFPKVGPKTAFKVASMTESDRNAWLASKGASCVERFKINERLVSFQCIPENLVQSFNEEYQFTFI
jgi:5'-3' exonuclease